MIKLRSLVSKGGVLSNSGWKGFDDYTDDKLKDAIEDWIDLEQIQELLESGKRRRKEQFKRWGKIKKRIKNTLLMTPKVISKIQNFMYTDDK